VGGQCRDDGQPNGVAVLHHQDASSGHTVILPGERTRWRWFARCFRNSIAVGDSGNSTRPRG
jgi:hypothetical protein